MHAPAITKYGFRIRTKAGAVVDNLLIFAVDAAAAEVKLRRMYPGCEVLAARTVPPPAPSGAVSYEDVVDLISGA